MLTSTILSNSSSLSKTSALALRISPGRPLAEGTLALTGVACCDGPRVGTMPLTSIAGDGGI